MLRSAWASRKPVKHNAHARIIRSIVNSGNHDGAPPPNAIVSVETMTAILNAMTFHDEPELADAYRAMTIAVDDATRMFHRACEIAEERGGADHDRRTSIRDGIRSPSDHAVSDTR